jgi:hypothetical protein
MQVHRRWQSFQLNLKLCELCQSVFKVNLVLCYSGTWYMQQNSLKEAIQLQIESADLFPSTRRYFSFYYFPCRVFIFIGIGVGLSPACVCVHYK